MNWSATTHIVAGSKNPLSSDMGSVNSVYNGMVYIEIDGRKGVLNLGETLAAGVEINEETLAEVVVEETAAPEV